MEVIFGRLGEFRLVNIFYTLLNYRFIIGLFTPAVYRRFVETLGGFVFACADFGFGVLKRVFDIADLLDEAEVVFWGKALGVVGTLQGRFVREIVEFCIFGDGFDILGLRSFSVDLHNLNILELKMGANKMNHELWWDLINNSCSMIWIYF